MTTVKGVRADPGGVVRLVFSSGGWTVERDTGWHPEPAQAMGLGILGCGLLAWAAELLDLRWLTTAMIVMAGLLLAGIIVLVLVEIVATVIGASWLAGSALTRGGRRRVRREARDFWSVLESAMGGAGPVAVAATRVGAARVAQRFGRTTVTLTLDDGSTQKYSSMRRRDQLAAAFTQLLGARLQRAI